MGGCVTKEGQPVLPAVPFFTKRSGKLTIERQEFVTTWASIQVIWTALLGQMRACGDPKKVAQLPEIEEQGKLVFLTVEAKLRNPEAQIDWANVEKILSLIAKLVL